ncbi:putative membrane-located cell surface saccharide saccharideacetylase protein [Sphingobium yanoikuyae]|uniref:Putative membrane-located cell surface saccharide saccharideacetylase protein n=2 Tax=Sphingobium yanoikuyae TaxID=13690 RepID=A0A084EPC1_SPHYA|nr:putative membrane-located cell surface saccharide saccharideacetylase protein [Sphingobium yanoikuyae]
MFGHAGVRLFFVLSGYLITLMLVQYLDARDAGRAPPLWHFYARRALRLWPAYILILGIATLLDWQDIRSVFWWHFLYGSNFLFAYTNDWQPWATAGWWSLSVEEQFYLIWPPVLLMTPQRFRVMAAVAFCALGIGLRLMLDPETVAFTTLPFSSFDALAGGALLAMADHRRKLSHWFPMVVPLALLGILFSWQFSSWLIVHIDETLCVLLFAGVVAFARQGYRGPAQWILGNPILRYLGRISYGMYLYHLFVMAFLFRDAARYSVMFQSRGWALMLFGTVITVALASLSWYLLEAPINRLKQRFPFPQ